MAYNPNRPPSGTHRSTPLISRPSSNPHQLEPPSRSTAQGMPQNYLGNMMGGALAGMGYPTAPPSQYNYPSHQNYPQGPQPPYYPPPQHQPYHYQQQQHPYYPPQPLSSYPQAPFPSTSTSSYPPPSRSNPHFPSSLPSRPSHSAIPPTSSFPSHQNSFQSHPRPPRPSGPPQSSSSRQVDFPCQLSTCPFTSRSRRTTREHEEDRHLLFEPGREPKPWSGSLKPLEGAVIEGTGLSLDTPEAVEKWIEDRKKRWPSKKVVEEKEKARDARVKAGLEEAPRVRGGAQRGGRGRGRGGAFDSSTRGNVRGGYGGVRQRTDERGEGENGEEPAKKKLKTNDGSSSASSSEPSSSSDSDDDSGNDSDEGPEAISTVSKEALKALLGDETAEEEDDDEQDEGEDGPVEESSSKPAADSTDLVTTETTTKKAFQVVCRHWRKGNCALGDAACPYLHTIPADQPLPAPRRNRPHPRQTPHNPFSRPFQDPFQLLEEQDLKHVVSDLLQVVDFLKANEFLRGVETRVGQLEEESGIQVLETEREGEGEGKKMIVEEPGEEEQELEREESPEEVEEEETPIEVEEQVVKEALKPAPTPPTRTSGLGIGLVADYASSDEEDEEAEEQVKQALLPVTSQTSST